MLVDHLVDSEQERVVAEGAAHTLLVEAELGCGDGLALRNQREVELELLVVTPLRREFPVVFDCMGRGEKNTQTRRAFNITASSTKRKKKTLNQTEKIFHNICFLFMFFFPGRLDYIFILTNQMQLDMISSQSGCQTWRKATTDVFKMIT